MKFKVGDKVNCDNYEMDGCCHDCEGTTHYLEFDTFVIDVIVDGEAFHKDCEYGYDLKHLKKLTKLEHALK